MLFNVLPKIHVVLGYEDQDGNAEEVRSMHTDAYFTLSLAGAISRLGFPRTDLAMAEVIGYLAEDGKLDEEQKEYYPGQNEDVSDLIDAAFRIRRGWAEHDAAFNNVGD